MLVSILHMFFICIHMSYEYQPVLRPKLRAKTGGPANTGGGLDGSGWTPG